MKLYLLRIPFEESPRENRHLSSYKRRVDHQKKSEQNRSFISEVQFLFKPLKITFFNCAKPQFKMNYSVILLVLAALFCLSINSGVSAKRFTKCGLARELVKHGIARGDLPNWICLVQSESNFNTAATNKNKNGSTDWGLFQINDGFWCKDGRPGGDCNVNCRCEWEIRRLFYLDL